MHYALKSIAAMFHIGMKESIFLKSEILKHLKGKNSKYLTVIFRGFPGVSVVKNACECRRCRRLVFNPLIRRIPRGGNGNPL